MMLVGGNADCDGENFEPVFFNVELIFQLVSAIFLSTPISVVLP